MLTLRAFTNDDSQLVLRLKEQAGWNQTPADLARFRALAPEGSFVAQWDGESIGCVMTFEFGSIAWIAMMLVDAAHRGHGIGRALMDRALEHLDSRGIPTVRLDATPLGEPLYTKLGFVPQFQLARYAGSVASVSGGQGVLPANPEQIEEIIDLDREATHTDRRNLLMALFGQQPGEVRVATHGDRVMGYVMSRAGAQARQIGPCIAAASCGERLLLDAAARHLGEKLYIDVPLINEPATRCVTSLGLTPQRTLTRMSRGVPVLEDVARLFASSSPEKG